MMLIFQTSSDVRKDKPRTIGIANEPNREGSSDVSLDPVRCRSHISVG